MGRPIEQRPRRRRIPVAFWLVSVASVLAVLPASAAAVGPTQLRTGAASLDARQAPAAARATAPIAPARAAAAATLGRGLGVQGIVSLDPLTGTPRQVARLDGFLTGPSKSSPAAVALGYVRAHQALFGLDRAALGALRKAPAYVSIDGTTHLRWMQQYRGVPVFENELRANVGEDGQLINVLGSPLTDTRVASTEPGLSAAAALRRARAAAGASGPEPAVTAAGGGAERATRFADGSQASLVIFHLPSGNVLAWHLYARVDSTHTYEEIVDAGSGRILFRDNIVDFANASGEGTAWSYNPSPIFGPGSGLADGHTQTLRIYPESWGPITPSASSGNNVALNGNNAHVYSDVNEDDQAEAGEEVAPTAFVSGKPVFNYPWTNYSNYEFSEVFGHCSTDFPCSWCVESSPCGEDYPNSGLTSWETNRRQNATQVFWFVNNYHDHLEEAPIGFTPAAGNFQLDDRGEGGVAGDPLLAENDDGADLEEGGPDEEHIDNANMATEQDGVSPRMQMYLFTLNGYVDANGGDEASIVYHEYTHGLSHRLITDAQGFPRLDGEEAGAMGEGWSDWYAMDYLVSQNLDTDTATTGDVSIGYYVSAGQHLLRSMAMDCPVGAAADTDCESHDGTGHQGGYTLADYGQVAEGPEVHADGEIWGQTLWQIREALVEPGTCPGPCSRKAEDLVTRAMELGPPDPSMLEERDAILLADQTDYNGADLTTLWQIFAQRGMGYYAADLGSSDTSPIADFHTPPAPAARNATISGRITDADTGAPVAGATVMFANHADLSAQTGADGSYTIGGIAPGTYPYLLVYAKGFDSVVRRTVNVQAGGNALSLTLRRDWAAASGGATVTSATAPDLTEFGCGPSGIIDGSQTSGWGSYSVGFGGEPGEGFPAAPVSPRAVVIHLPRPVDVRQFAIDPGATCGDDDTASLGQFSIEASADGSSYHPVASGLFSAANDHQMNPVSLTGNGAGTSYVRLTMLANQGSDGESSHVAYQRFMDMSEFEVYGVPSAPPAPPTPAAPAPAVHRKHSPAPRHDGEGGGLLGSAAPLRHQRLAKVRARGLKVKVSCRAACKARISLYLDARTARHLGLARVSSPLARHKGKRPVLVGSARVRLRKAGARTVTVRLKRKAKRRLAHVRKVKLRLVVAVTGAGGAHARKSSVVTLRR